MTISKSLRFEVLRRDGFACTYCGRKPPDVELHIDHVQPEALGGRGEAQNLATACAECNIGKGSTPPSADLVADVAADAQRWTWAVSQAAAEMVDRDGRGRWFVDRWNECGLPAEHLPLDAEQRITRLLDQGLPRSTIEDMFWVALEAHHNRRKYAYFTGCCNRRLDELHARAMEIVEGDDGGQA